MKNFDQALTRKPYYHTSHARPRTRRELMGQGFLGSTAFAFGPSLLGFMGGLGASSRALAAECGLNAAATSGIPALVIELSGGASTCGGNICVGRDGDATDTSHFTESAWTKLGHAPAFRYNSNGDNVARDLGLPMVNSGGFYRGITSVASAATRANTNGMVFCARSDNDTSTNPHNPVFALLRAGAAGSITPVTGNQPTAGGALAQSPYIDNAKMALVVNNPKQARALQDTVKIMEVMGNNPATASIMLRAISQLSEKRIARMSETELAKTLFQCKYEIAREKAINGGGSAAVDPLADLDIVDTFGTAAMANNDSTVVKAATATKLVLGGFAGVGVVQASGFDYHNGTRTTGDALDYEIGQCIGAALECAARKSTPLVVYVYSDGSVTGAKQTDSTGNYIWQADDATTAGTFMLSYNPAGRIPFINQQMGDFRRDGSNNRQALLGGDLMALVDAVALNYMALNGNAGQFGQLFPSSALGKNQLQHYAGPAI